MPKFFELFAGAGGMTMGFEAAGWECVGHAEIEPHARAVLRHKWPEVPLYGDVSQLDGTTLPPFDLLTFGAPCQDLSIAGKRAGMAEGSGTRSSLFFEAIRIWKESSAPLALYENVLGAYSSNDGKDFAAVLSAFVGAAVLVPADGWRGAGVASGPAGIAAWRTVDLQHFGWDGNTTPQRRRRVFVLGTRTGAVDPAEVLLVADGLLGNLAACEKAGEGTAEDAVASVDGPRKRTLTFQASGDIDNRSISVFDEMHPTLRTSQNSDGGVGVLTYDARGNGEGVIANTLSGDHQNRVTDYTALVLRSEATAFNWQSGGDVRLEPRTEQANTLQANQTQAVILSTNASTQCGDVAGGLTARADGSPCIDRGPNVVFTSAEPKVGTPFRMTAIGEYTTGETSSALKACDHKEPKDLVVPSVGIPRRLMPIECERLMGWPDHHTAMGTDEQGRDYALSDTARYKLCGNGVGSPVTAWIGMRLKSTLDKRRLA